MAQDRFGFFMINRRQIFSAGAKALAGSAAALSFPHIARADVLAANEKRLSFFNTHTSEKTRSLFWADGQPIAEGLKEIDHILRDWRAEETHPIDTGLLDLLFVLRNRLDSSRPFEIISGYRSPVTNKTLRKRGGGGVAKKSLHMRGMAVDIRLPGRGLADVRNAAIALRRGGVGYYPQSGFVHVDTGRVRRWS